MTRKELEVQIEDCRQELDLAMKEKRGAEEILGLSVSLDHLIEVYLDMSRK